MRTRLVIDDALFRELKKRAAEENRTLSEVRTELLRTLIRNACVNDGRAESGQEARSVDALEDFFAGSGLDVERHQSLPGRMSLIARIEGRDPAAPRLLLMGHTDVVPVNSVRLAA
jgi:acetylornithine deacetylase/succinyl-diaminopimelate desuccinylase-like protein